MSSNRGSRGKGKPSRLPLAAGSLFLCCCTSPPHPGQEPPPPAPPAQDLNCFETGDKDMQAWEVHPGVRTDLFTTR